MYQTQELKLTTNTPYYNIDWSPIRWGGGIAQRSEQGAHNALVVGSTPTAPTITYNCSEFYPQTAPDTLSIRIERTIQYPSGSSSKATITTLRKEHVLPLVKALLMTLKEQKND